MTTSQKNAIWYSYRKIKIEKFKKFLYDNRLFARFFYFRRIRNYTYYMNYVRFFCKEYNIVYNEMTKNYEKRT